jgi:oxaloacetate decarboxylase alpha subunit
VSQVPGGMLSNLESQLREQGAADRMDAVLDEIAVVQKDFGYPPLVTPTSQIVGSQAVLNVLMGRYRQLTTESRNLLVGHYGATPIAPNPDLVREALRELKMAQPLENRPADQIPAEMDKLGKEFREKSGISDVTPEDVLTYAMFPQVALAFFKSRSKGPAQIEPPAAPEKAAAVAPPQTPGGRYVVKVDDETFEVAAGDESDGRLSLTVDGHAFSVAVAAHTGGAAPAPQSAGKPSGKGEAVRAPMPGTVIKLARPDGSQVAENETVVILEALKMQMEIRSRSAGRLRYCVRAGETVTAQAVLAEVV